MATSAPLRARPSLDPRACRGCGRCIESCAHHCIEPGHDIQSETGLVPVVLHLEDCTACGLCLAACPEPYGLVADGGAPRPQARRVEPEDLPDERLPLPAFEPIVV